MAKALSLFRHCWIQRLALLSLALLLQGPAMLTQEIAWVKMLASYTQDRGLVRGVVETFDGEHPCEMCHQAQQLRQAQNQPGSSEEFPREALLRWMSEWGKLLPSSHGLLRDPWGQELEPQFCCGSPMPKGRDAEGPAAPPPRLA